MDETQIQSLVEQLKAAGLDEEKIMDVFFKTFQAGKMDRKDLETLANFLGYELTDDFKNDSTPDPIASKGVEGMSEEELEDARTIDDGESAEEFKDNLDSLADGEGSTDSEGDEDGEGEDKGEEDSSDDSDDTEDTEEESEDSDEGDDDDAEWEKVQKMFKI